MKQKVSLTLNLCEPDAADTVMDWRKYEALVWPIVHKAS